MRVVKYNNQSDPQAALSKQLYDASVVYYGGKTPLMSDIEFDRLLEVTLQWNARAVSHTTIARP